MLMNSVESVGSNDDFTTYLDGSIRQHQGWMALEAFGQLLSNKALDERSLKYFLASTACFFREIPGGILALALRVMDDRIDNDRFGASHSAASILLAAVDEFGLGSNSTGVNEGHHQLFATMAKRFGVAEAELLTPGFILPEAIDLARITQQLYREGCVAKGVGLHFASEISSEREFQLCYNGMARHLTAYAGDSGDIAPEKLFDFYFVHTVVEPEHGSASARAVNLYSDSEIDRQAVLDGAEQFMDAYGAFWSAINRTLEH
jgi:hypothetical protein